MRPARRRWRCQSRLCGPAQSASPEWRVNPTPQETPPSYSRRQRRCRRFEEGHCRIESAGGCREEAPRSLRPPRRQESLPRRRVSGSGRRERTHSGRALWSWGPPLYLRARPLVAVQVFPRTQARRWAGERSSPDPGDSRAVPPQRAGLPEGVRDAGIGARTGDEDEEDPGRPGQ